MYLKCIYLVYILYTDLPIREFMDVCTAAFPTVRRTVKMHLLEDHATELVEATKMGFGSMGEQGAEAIHAQFNSLMRTYSCVPNKVERLKRVMQEHYLNFSPQLQSLRPPQAKRKKKGLS